MSFRDARTMPSLSPSERERSSDTDIHGTVIVRRSSEAPPLHGSERGIAEFRLARVDDDGNTHVAFDVDDETDARVTTDRLRAQRRRIGGQAADDALGRVLQFLPLHRPNGDRSTFIGWKEALDCLSLAERA